MRRARLSGRLLATALLALGVRILIFGATVLSILSATVLVLLLLTALLLTRYGQNVEPKTIQATQHATRRK
ncbi:MAG TPA: hypothetical protein VG293_02345 [Solirubrobacteraceae bacterium]|nr:hypothetical protein [Solirubrobacteraceae bacterium]